MYFLRVNLLTHWQEPLWYSASFDQIKSFSLDEKNLFLVSCLLRKSSVVGLVVQIEKVRPVGLNFEVRPILDIVVLPLDPFYLKFLTTITSLFGVPITSSLRRLSPFLEKFDSKSFSRSEFFLNEEFLEPRAILTEVQAHVVNCLVGIMEESSFSQSLLHGVTGSGKTQIYLKLILKALSLGKTVLILVPEVSLARHFFDFFSKTLAGLYSIFAWHSAVEKKSKKGLWQALIAADPVLIIGVHQPVFLPLQNLGLIIIDEEHDDSFVEMQPPFLNTKLLAVLKAKFAGVPIIYGSATPSLSTYHQSQHAKGWYYFYLNERYGGSFPTIQIVQLEPKKKNFWMTKELQEKILDRLAKKQQVILFLNRRGFAKCLCCFVCKASVQCLNCSVSLTVYKNSQNESFLECHYCGYKKPLIRECSCGAVGKMMTKGLGTEQVAKALEEIFPQAKILRFDANSVRKKGWQEDLQKFSDGRLDILVGTKILTKGYHFPNVTLVAALWADLDFSFPDYKSRESGVAQLLQVIGRAGRGEIVGEVLIQAFDKNLVAQVLDERDYKNFALEELVFRKDFGYPPFTKLIFIETSSVDQEVALRHARLIVDKVQKFFCDKSVSATILGPARPVIFKKEKKIFEQIMIKIYDPALLEIVLRFISALRKEIVFDYWLEV